MGIYMKVYLDQFSENVKEFTHPLEPFDLLLLFPPGNKRSELPLKSELFLFSIAFCTSSSVSKSINLHQKV